MSHRDELQEAARAVSAHAYCKYSGFRVGAAVRARDGRIFAAPNIENASYGLTLCAERNAIFKAVGEGCTDLVEVCLYTPTPRPATPCGACRQVMAELATSARVLCICDGDEQREFASVDALIPDAFAL